jgi:hypothetical protein
MRIFKLLVLLLMAVACSCGDSTSPDDGTLNGRWRFTFSQVRAQSQFLTSIPCAEFSLAFSIQQSDTTFHGTQNGTGRVICTTSTGTVFDNRISLSEVANGVVKDSIINFWLKAPRDTFPNPGVSGIAQGTYNGKSFSGNFWMTLQTFGAFPQLEGRFEARRY